MAELNHGWVGKILRVDLTNGKLTEVPTSNYAPKFIGGRSMGAKIYWDEVPPEVGAFDPENKLIMMQGPVNGTVIPNACRTSITAKSPIPIPECYSYSIPGGHWGPELKFAGYDGIIIEGESPEPVYLWIHDGVAEIKKAGFLWGQLTSTVDQELKQLYGLQTKTMVIGPAGENLVREAVILLDGFAAAGMGGFGAVMGSKNLKAIAVRGTGSVKIAEPQKLIDLRQDWASAGLGLDVGEVFYGLFFPTHLSDAVAEGRATKKDAGCWGCQLNCQIGLRFQDLDVQSSLATCNDISEMQQDDFFRTGQYMTTDGWEFGRLCNDLGISITQIIGHTVPWFVEGHHGGTWATELVWAGLWTPENTGLPVGPNRQPYSNSDPELGVGTKEFNRALLKKVAYREGIGDLIAEGQQRYLKHVVETAPAELREAAQEIYDRVVWGESHRSIWQPRHIADGWVRFITNAVHMVHGPAAAGTGIFSDNMFPLIAGGSEEYKEEYIKQAVEFFGEFEKHFDMEIPDYKAEVAIYEQNVSMERDSLTSCMYGAAGYFTMRDFGLKSFSAATGQSEVDFKDWLKQVGERSYNLERAIMVREGRRREHDTMNEYHLTEAKWPEPDGPSVSRFLDKDLFNEVMDEYYTLRGWDLTTGIPTRSRLEELGMEDVADDLEQRYGVTVTA